jgi:cation transport ATPase
MPSTSSPPPSPAGQQVIPWGSMLAVASMLAIAAHLLLGALKLPPLHLSYSSELAVRDMPLLLVIFLSAPLLIRIGGKILGGNIGADFLGAIELVAATLLDQYLAAVLIILMLSGGQALEAYAMRRASSVLRALAERMPATAHRKRDSHIEEIAISEIAVGDDIVVFPHETAPGALVT